MAPEPDPKLEVLEANPYAHADYSDRELEELTAWTRLHLRTLTSASAPRVRPRARR